MKTAYIDITSWTGISIGATHYYGKLFYGKARVEIKAPLTKSQAKEINEKDSTTSISIARYKEGDLCSRFDTEEEVINAGINIYKEFILPQGFDILILGDPAVADPQYILEGDDELLKVANKLYNDFEEYYGWDCRKSNESKVRNICKKWDKIMKTFIPPKRYNLKIADKDDPDNFWIETYLDKDLEKWDCKTPEELGEALMNFFNGSLKPYEKERIFLGIES